MKKSYTIFWFRRDLRLEDNAGLYQALRENQNVIPVFVFDTEILDRLGNKKDRRVDFIHQALGEIQKELLEIGSSLLVLHGTALNAFDSLLSNYKVTKVYCNHDYEPYARKRDIEIKDFLETKRISFHTFKDHCFFEKNEVLKDDGKPYTVFTPYSRKWKAKLKPFHYKAYPTKKYYTSFFKGSPLPIPTLQSLGFKKTEIVLDPNITVKEFLLLKYKEQRDYPAIEGTSRLSIYLRFGLISIRGLVAKSIPLSETWLNELIWRDFYMMILWHFPHVAQNSFKPAYDKIPWHNNEIEFEKWCTGKTGFPIVDAGMRELNATGFMHNRVRMIVSSFLVKDLLIDWRWGEAYFAGQLNDFDLSANNGGWQWASGSGCDAAPYFRVFNPYEQQKKFDPEFVYIKKWIPELGSSAYPLPIVNHNAARLKALTIYKNALIEAKQLSLL